MAANGVTTQHHYVPQARNSLNELAIVTLVVEAPLVLLASPNSQFNNLNDLISFSKLNPSRVDYATVGQGGVLQMSADLLQKTVGINWNPIPYQGGASATTDLFGNRIHVLFDSVATGKTSVASGARPLAVTSSYRSRLMPEVQTLVELGYDIDFRPWQAVFVSAATEESVKRELNAIIRRTLNNPDTIRRFYDAGFDKVIGSNLQQSNQILNDEVQRWNNLLK